MDREYLIVLGGPIKDDKPSELLFQRIKTAADFMNENPQSLAIVSGGMTNESCSLTEAEIMKNSLVELGISEDRIILEKQARTTLQNFQYASELIPEGSRIFFVTNRFHIWRSRRIMQAVGLDGQALAAPNGKHSLSFRIREAFLRPPALFGKLG